MSETLCFSIIHKQIRFLAKENFKGICKSVLQIRRSSNLNETEKIVTA